MNAFFTEKGYNVLQVRLRRMQHTKEFKGSAFVELDSVEAAKKCAGDEHSSTVGPLITEMKEECVSSLPLVVAAVNGTDFLTYSCA